MQMLQQIDWSSMFTPETFWAIVRIVLYAVGGLILLRLLVVIVRRILRRRSTPQVTMLITKSINYVGLAAIVTIVLLELGVNLAPILGAAGIVGLAVGIASQASLSNIISGLFLVSEKPFQVGDVVRIGETTGVVDSIDLLSVKLRTFDNTYIRVPNEKLANTQFTNVTRFPIRRLDVVITVPFSQDLTTVYDLLMSLAKSNPLCLDEPEPIVIFTGHNERGCSVLFGVWFQRADFIKVRNSVYREIGVQFAATGIELAVPRRTLSGDGSGEPIPIEIVSPADPEGESSSFE